MTEQSMVDKVARALWAKREQTFPGRTRVAFEDRMTDQIFDDARAAIEAMREPTEIMLDGSLSALELHPINPKGACFHKFKMKKRWQAMISEALK